jgi:hypothetical protein
MITEPLTQLQVDQRVFDLYDEYCHGGAATLSWQRTVAFFKRQRA